MPVLTTIAIASAADFFLPIGSAVGGSLLTSALWWWNGKQNKKSPHQGRLKDLEKIDRARRIKREQQATSVVSETLTQKSILATQTEEIQVSIAASTAKIERCTNTIDDATIELMSLPELFGALRASNQETLAPIISELQSRLDALSHSEDELLNQNQTLGDRIAELEASLEQSGTTTKTLEYDISENKRVVQSLNSQLQNLSEELRAYASHPIDNEETERLRSQNKALARKLAQFSQKAHSEQRALIEKNDQLQQLIIALTESKQESSSTASSKRSSMTMF